MKLVILHYHLNPGGVTQVILNQLRALDQLAASHPREVLVLHGGRKQGWPEGIAAELTRVKLRDVAIAGLDYDDGKVAAEALVGRLKTALADDGADPADTLLLCHNPTLGKNVSLPLALANLVDAGYRCLHQIHDFAEDFRPANYLRLEHAWRDLGGLSRLYPQASSIHYAGLTGRDVGVLAAAGLERLHRLPNPVIAAPPVADRKEARRQLQAQFGIAPSDDLLLYPVRGIRRKNVGEAVLWAALGGAGTAVAITLPPQNPVERQHYRQWQRFARRHEVPCIFDVGAPGSLTFDQNLSAADAMLTTSVAEGFGMVFLETWLRGKPLVGRNLPEVTADFVEEGLRLDHLYDALLVPLDLLDPIRARSDLRDCFDGVLSAYGRETSRDADFNAAWRELTGDDAIDFAYLSVSIQRRLIARAVSDATVRSALLERNPKIAQGLHACDRDRIAHNAAGVARGYSPEATGRALQQALESLAASACGRATALPSYERVLDNFLKPKKCHPLRVEQAPKLDPLVEIIRRESRPLSPTPTGESPQLCICPDVQAVLFDIYGTLLVSGSGEVGVADLDAPGADPREAAFAAAWSKAALGAVPVSGPARLVEAIQRDHARIRDLGTPFPEVDILEIWEEVVWQLATEDPPPLSWVELAALATEYEVRVNPVWPMPGLLETIGELRERGLRLGLVSNAQCFTPAIFDALCERSLTELGFEEALSFFSYEHQAAKPGLELFEQAVEQLQKLEIPPKKVLYVGNDMRNDVMPASKLGMQTALFAGDQRSLRWRNGDPSVAGITPDIVLTDLDQLRQCLSSS